MTRILYDLALADEDVRPSPYCWIAKFALLHKGLRFETKPVPFADKSKYPDPVYAKVPVIDFDGELVRDSTAIAVWLDKKFPTQPLTKSDGERAAAAFYSSWLAAALYPAIAPILIPKLAAVVADADKVYFRSSREGRFGKSLEEVAATPGHKEKSEAAIAVLSTPLTAHRFLGGGAPNLCDYLVFAPFMWQRSVTSETLYETPKPVADWQGRMLDLYDGYARAAKCANA